MLYYKGWETVALANVGNLSKWMIRFKEKTINTRCSAKFNNFLCHLFTETAWCINELVMESIKIKVVVGEKSADVKYWKPGEYLKRVTCIMRICNGYPTAEILTVAQRSMNSIKVIWYDMDSCNGEYEVVASRKWPSSCSYCLHIRIHSTRLR